MIDKIDAKDLKIERLTKEVARQKLLIDAYELDVKISRDVYDNDMRTIKRLALPAAFGIGIVVGLMLGMLV